MADNNFRVNRGITLNPQSNILTNPVNGDIYYDAIQGSFVFYNNGFWINLASQTDIPSATTLNSVEFTPAIVQNSLVRVTGSTASGLYGLTATTGGKQVVVYNAGTSTVTVFSLNAGEPTAANRILTPDNANIVLTAGQALALIYDATAGNWIISSGSGGSGGTGIAQEVTIPVSSTSISVTFPSALTTTTYTVLAQMVNETDPNPEFQPITITNKTTTGFTATWNAPVDTSSYHLDYIVAGAQEQMGEALIPISGTSVTVTLPIPLNSNAYVVIGEFVNTVDAHPQFQPVTVVLKTTSSFTVSWNAPVNTSNYRLAYQVASYQ